MGCPPPTSVLNVRVFNSLLSCQVGAWPHTGWSLPLERSVGPAGQTGHLALVSLSEPGSPLERAHSQLEGNSGAGRQGEPPEGRAVWAKWQGPCGTQALLAGVASLGAMPGRTPRACPLPRPGKQPAHSFSKCEMRGCPVSPTGLAVRAGRGSTRMCAHGWQAAGFKRHSESKVPARGAAGAAGLQTAAGVLATPGPGRRAGSAPSGVFPCAGFSCACLDWVQGGVCGSQAGFGGLPRTHRRRRGTLACGPRGSRDRVLSRLCQLGKQGAGTGPGQGLPGGHRGPSPGCAG